MFKRICGKKFNKTHYFQAHQNICSEITQEKYIQQYEKINGVPKVVFVYWFGRANK